MPMITSIEDRLSSVDAAAAHLAIPQGAFETRHQPGREVGVVDGLVSVTQRAWRLDVGVGKRDAGPVVEQ